MYMNYTEAYYFCNSKSMRLVEIYGENQNNFIKDLTANNPQDSYYGPTFGYWIDLVHINTYTYQGWIPKWKWNYCNHDVKFTSWYEEGDWFGNASINAYMETGRDSTVDGDPPVALGWFTADDSITASPLCQIFPEAPGAIPYSAGFQTFCPLGM